MPEVRQKEEFRSTGHLGPNDKNGHADHTYTCLRGDLLHPRRSKAEPNTCPATKECPEKRDA
jgi:hypothetical protein